MLFRLIVVLFLLVLFHGVNAAPESATALDKAEHMQQQMQNHTTDVFKQAEDLSQSSALLNELDQAASKISKLKTFPKTTSPDLPDPDPAQLARTRTAISQLLDQAEQQKGLTNLTDPNHAKGPPFYIFVSFSMPDLTLRRLMEQARRINAPLVLRGLVDNDMNKTRIKLSQLLGADKQGKTTIEGGLSIDPTLYMRFGITVVPAFVLSVTAVSACTQTDCPTPDFVRLAGNITVDYALETMGKAVPAMRSVSETLLTQLRSQTP